MKKRWMFRLCIFAIVLMMALVFASCENPTSSSSSSGGRKALQDGVYPAEVFGYHKRYPLTMETTIANNAIVNITIVGGNSETYVILDSVRERLIPRIIENQSIGVDSIAGATYSSAAVKEGVEIAIEAAGGNVDEWYVAPKKKTGVVQHFNYDVIVVGLGSSGIAAYLAAAEASGLNGAVFGMDVAGKVGGNSAVAGGPMAINSTYMRNRYTGGNNYINRNAILQQWYADMKAQVPQSELDTLGSQLTSFIPPYRGTMFGVTANTTTSYNVPQVVAQEPTPYVDHGGAKWDLVKFLIDNSGGSVDWLSGQTGGQQYYFNFTTLSSLNWEQYPQVTVLGNDHASTSGLYDSDDGADTHKTYMFLRALNIARRRNPRNVYMLELRGRELITVEDKVVGVRATSYDGTIHEVYGRAVVLATGGFIGNRQMTKQTHGYELRSYAVTTHQGDGINMARAIGAGTYNMNMPTMVHIAQVPNIIQQRVMPTVAEDERVKSTMTALLHKRDSILIALNHGPGNIDLRGKRFINEAGAQFANNAIDFGNWRAGHYYGAIFSDDVIEDLKTNGAWHIPAPSSIAHPQGGSDGGYGSTAPPGYVLTALIPARTNTGAPATTGVGSPITFMDDMLRIGEQTGNIIRAKTLDELATKLGLPGYGATIRDTIIQYNSYYPKNPPAFYGGDSSYKGVGNYTAVPAGDTYQKPQSTLGNATWTGDALNYTYPQVNPGTSTTDEVGYTVILGAGYGYGTCAGLDVNVNIQVLRDDNKEPIPGLYAVGQESMGVLFDWEAPYASYGAVAYGWSFTSGRRAGQNASAYAATQR